MDDRTFIAKLVQFGLDSVRARMAALTNLVNGLVTARRGSHQNLITAIDQSDGTPDDSAVTYDINTWSQWGVGGLRGRAVYGAFMSAGVAGPAFAYERQAGTLAYQAATFFGTTPSDVWGLGFGGVFRSNGHPVFRFSNTPDYGLAGAAIQFKASAGAAPGWLSLISSASGPNRRERARHACAVLDIDNDTRTGNSASGVTLTISGSGTTAVFSGAPGTFPQSGTGAIWGLGSVVKITNAGTAGTAVFVDMPFQVAAAAADGSSITVEGGIRPSTWVDGTYTGLTVQLLRGVKWYINQDGAMVLSPTHQRIDDADFYNGEQVSIGALVNSAGQSAVDYGAGAGLYIYDGTTKVGSTIRGFRRLGHGARSVTISVNTAPLVAVDTTIRGTDKVLVTNSGSAGLVICGSGGAAVLPDSYDGHEVSVVNVGANSFTLQSVGLLATSNIRLKTDSLTLLQWDAVQLVFVASAGEWIELDRSVAPLRATIVNAAPVVVGVYGIVEQTVGLTGVSAGDFVNVAYSNTIPDGLLWCAYCTGNTVRVRVYDASGLGPDLPAGTWHVTVERRA